ncbi:MAG: N-acetyltransferase [Nocardioides sp.]|jgi:ribosomal-protein-alanine N-acetyltransferase|uniref:GNAT family N-acetyltransferase n=1 Tax=Nocardioides sp. TaxID=35761 RepID=UPI002629324F|nr:GNAT family protein [Nocardioides sp.]MCW2835238.1 N-acetyltransferase [Nocardioides sp.]
MTTAPGWPARLTDDGVTLRPLVGADAQAWREVRQRNGDWLKQWDATVPPGATSAGGSYAQVVRRLRKLARQGQSMPFAIEVDGRFVGQVTVNNIVRGSAQFASLGYWLDRSVAGRGIMPTAVAMVIDHCFTTAGLHRIEVCVRPENTNSLRVVEKLGLHEVGYAPRFLHINGDWRDHRIFAVTVEDCPGGMLARLSS